MGCHTWFHKRVEAPDKDMVLKRLNLLIDYNKKLIDNGARDFISLTTDVEISDIERLNIVNDIVDENVKIKNLINNLNYDDIDSWAELYLGISDLPHLSKIVNLYEDGEVDFNLYDFDSYVDYIKGRGFYKSVDSFHNLFRVYDYPEDCLFSLQECLDYIKLKNADTFDFTYSALEEFWNKYPDGMVDFG